MLVSESKGSSHISCTSFSRYRTKSVVFGGARVVLFCLSIEATTLANFACKSGMFWELMFQAPAMSTEKSLHGTAEKAPSLAHGLH